MRYYPCIALILASLSLCAAQVTTSQYDNFRSGAMAYWNGHAFFASIADHLRSYAIKSGQLAISASSSNKFADPGCHAFHLRQRQ